MSETPNDIQDKDIGKPTETVQSHNKRRITMAEGLEVRGEDEDLFDSVITATQNRCLSSMGFIGYAHLPEVALMAFAAIRKGKNSTEEACNVLALSRAASVDEPELAEALREGIVQWVAERANHFPERMDEIVDFIMRCETGAMMDDFFYALRSHKMPPESNISWDNHPAMQALLEACEVSQWNEEVIKNLSDAMSDACDIIDRVAARLSGVDEDEESEEDEASEEI